MLKLLHQAFLNLINPKKICVAYSGGIDSHVLLHALASLRVEAPDFKLRAVHINHGLHVKADIWAQHCWGVCQDLGIELTIIKVQVEIQTRGLEAAARSARYGALEAELAKNECLVTAHHLNDQAETLLLQLLRGSGPKGLAAMPMTKPFGLGQLWRPFLGVSQAEIKHYADEHVLQWIEDDSNEDLHFDRNYLRLQVMPILLTRWPGALTTISRSADLCAKSCDLLDEYAREDFNKTFDPDNNTLAIEKMQLFSRERVVNLIRYWLIKLGLPLPNSSKLTALVAQMLTAKEDAQPLVVWLGAEVRRFAGRLYAMKPLSAHDPTVILPWDLQAPLVLPSDLGMLTAVHHPAGKVKLFVDAQGIPKNVSIRFRQGGERFDAHALKKCLQVWQIPPWQRERLPLLYQDKALIAVLTSTAVYSTATVVTKDTASVRFQLTFKTVHTE